MEKIYFIFLFILIVNSSNIDHNKVNTNNKENIDIKIVNTTVDQNKVIENQNIISEPNYIDDFVIAEEIYDNPNEIQQNIAVEIVNPDLSDNKYNEKRNNTNVNRARRNKKTNKSHKNSTILNNENNNLQINSSFDFVNNTKIQNPKNNIPNENNTNLKNDDYQENDSYNNTIKIDPNEDNKIIKYDNFNHDNNDSISNEIPENPTISNEIENEHHKSNIIDISQTVNIEDQLKYDEEKSNNDKLNKDNEIINHVEINNDDEIDNDVDTNNDDKLNKHVEISNNDQYDIEAENKIEKIKEENIIKESEPEDHLSDLKENETIYNTNNDDNNHLKISEDTTITDENLNKHIDNIQNNIEEPNTKIKDDAIIDTEPIRIINDDSKEIENFKDFENNNKEENVHNDKSAPNNIESEYDIYEEIIDEEFDNENNKHSFSNEQNLNEDLNNSLNVNKIENSGNDFVEENSKIQDSSINEPNNNQNYNIISKLFNFENIEKLKNIWLSFLKYTISLDNIILKILPYPYNLMVFFLIGYYISKLLSNMFRRNNIIYNQVSNTNQILQIESKFKEFTQNLKNSKSDQDQLKILKDVIKSQNDLFADKMNLTDKKIALILNKLENEFKSEDSALQNICDRLINIVESLA